MKPSDLSQQMHELQPTQSFIGAAWAVLVIGVLAFLVGIVRVDTLAFK